MKKISFALVGAGKMGTRWAGVLSKNKDVSLDIIIDSSLDKAAKLLNPDSYYASTDIKSILEVDAVLVAVPHKYLFPITGFALKSDKHVLCEKPGAITSGQITKNADLAKKKGLVYKIGYNYRFHDAFVKARNLFEKGAIGDLVFIRA